ncbi:MAG: starch-binding protein [Ruminococcus sp.]|nr:starch-binding protein [Ruminococcus sp.]
MKNRLKKAISVVLASTLVICQSGIMTASAASSAEGKTIYFKLPNEWKDRVDANTGEAILPAAYTAGGTDGEHVPWVGDHMTLVDAENDIYSYTLPGDQTFVIFNTGQQRDWQTVDLAIPGGDMIFLVDKGAGTKTATGHWEPYNTDEPRVAINTGVFQFVGNTTINLYSFNCDNAYYSVDGGEAIPYESGQAVTIGNDAKPLTDTSITLTAVKGDTSYSYEYTFSKNSSRTIYAKNSAGWENIYIHYWGGESNSVWPGVKMQPYADSEDVYYCEIPSKSTNYKFNNGKGENTSGVQQSQNLATQDLVTGVSEVYVVNPLVEGDSANTGEYVTLERALSDEPVEGLPIISVDDCAPAFGEEFNINVNLQNVSKLSGYVVNLSFDNKVIAPVDNKAVVSSPLGDIVTNLKSNGDLTLVCSNADAVSFDEKAVLASIPFKVVGDSTTQTKVSVKVADMFADENTEITFPSSNLLSGKVTVGVDKTVLKEKIDYINSLDENNYTPASYQSAIAVANNSTAIYESLTATQDIVDAQVALLDEAIAALEEAQGDGNFYYFENALGWEDVHVYWWGGSTACASFPGIKATPVSGRANVYQVELPDDATGLNFNNGNQPGEGGQQTDSITGTKLIAGQIFIPNPDDSYEKNGGLRFRGEAKKYVPNIYYFRNTAEWEKVYAYWWGSSTECPAFPGIPATAIKGTDNLYSIQLPEDATGLNFNNGNQPSESGEQTDSITGDNLALGNVFIPNPEDTYEKNGGLRYRGVAEKYTPNTIYFQNVAEWDEVYCYWWGSSTECPAFPGVQPTLLAGTFDIYYITLPEDATGFNFSNGNQPAEGGEQTSSMSTFNAGQLLIIDLDSAYEKNGGIRYDASYDILEKYTTGVDVLVGDVNQDGIINISDVTEVQKKSAELVEFDEIQTLAADVNENGKINIMDATAIQRYCAEMEHNTITGTYVKYFAL